MRCFLKHLWLEFYHEALPIILFVIGVFGFFLLIDLGNKYLKRQFGEEFISLIWAIAFLLFGGIMTVVVICKFITWCIKTWKECNE